MGTGASRTSVENNDEVRQLDTLHPLKRQPVVQPHRPSVTPPPVQHAKIERQPKQKEREWPLPPNERDEEFKLEWSKDPERYSVKRAYNLKASSSNKKFKATHVTEIKDFHQKETSSTQWKKQNSSIHNSAHVQSSLYTQSHACIDLSTTEEIDRLFASLSEVHAEVDLNVEQQQKLISEVTKAIIDTITSDTRNIQQNLLIFGKEKQIRQDELYREWLQMYIIELDQWKSIRLANLQEQMEMYQKKIMTHSHRWIMQVNTEANNYKEEIRKAAEQAAYSKIQQLIEQIQAISIHHLGTETMTKINLIIHGNVGNKMSGQGCTFDFEQCDKPDERKVHGAVENQLIRKDRQKSNQIIISKQANVKKRIVEHEHEEQVVAFEQREQIEEKQHISYVENYEHEDEDEQ